MGVPIASTYRDDVRLMVGERWRPDAASLRSSENVTSGWN
jgi:hypothetical protein